MNPHPESLYDLNIDRLERALLPLYNTLLDRHATAGRRSAEGKWRMGALIRFVRTEHVYRDHGVSSFADWVKGRCGFDVEQANRYELIADFPLDLLRDLDIDVHRLIAVRTKEPLFWPPLLTAAAEGASDVRLNRAARSGMAHLVRHQDEAAARAHVLSVARGEEDALKPEPQEQKPCKLGIKLVRLLRGGVRVQVAQLRKWQAAGRDMSGRWMLDLRDEVLGLQKEVLALCQAAAPAGAKPAPGPLPGREDPKKENDSKQIDTKIPGPGAPAPSWICPDPCPLCQGRRKPPVPGAQLGSIVHSRGCAMLLRGRRCYQCGATINPDSKMTHASGCPLPARQDAAHVHTWRCTLDPRCVYYKGSPADPTFALPPDPKGPTDRPWLYQPVPWPTAPAPAPAPAPAKAPAPAPTAAPAKAPAQILAPPPGPPPPAVPRVPQRV